MSSLFLMSTITDRRTADAFLQLYEAHGVNVTLRTVGTGTAVQETLSTLGLEKTEKAVLLAVVTAQTWQEVQRDLRRKMRIDVPGTGIAFTVPLSSIGGKRALGFLTEHQTLTWKEESTLKDTRYELLLVIANQGYTGSIMDAARAAGAGGGTVIRCRSPTPPVCACWKRKNRLQNNQKRMNILHVCRQKLDKRGVFRYDRRK